MGRGRQKKQKKTKTTESERDVIIATGSERCHVGGFEDGEILLRAKEYGSLQVL